MTILNGKEVSKTIKNNLKSEVKDLIETTGECVFRISN